jgi:hypothetical protein
VWRRQRSSGQRAPRDDDRASVRRSAVARRRRSMCTRIPDAVYRGRAEPGNVARADGRSRPLGERGGAGMAVVEHLDDSAPSGGRSVGAAGGGDLRRSPLGLDPGGAQAEVEQRELTEALRGGRTLGGSRVCTTRPRSGPSTHGRTARSRRSRGALAGWTGQRRGWTTMHAHDAAAASASGASSERFCRALRSRPRVGDSHGGQRSARRRVAARR